MENEFNVSTEKFDSKIKPYLDRITKGKVTDVDKYDKLLNVEGRGYVDIFETHKGVMILADFCSDKILSKLEKLSK